MVDLGGYVIILVETREKRVKLYGKERMPKKKPTLLVIRLRPAESFLNPT
jgi:hypothetical protein